MRHRQASGIIRRYGALIVLAVMFVVFAILQKGFLQADNLFSILRQTGIVAIVALGVTAVLAVGEFDISFGTVASFAGILHILLLKQGMNLYLTWVIALIASVAIALFNTYLIINWQINSFIATLGTQALLMGFAKWITNGSTILMGSYPPNFDLLGQGMLWDLIPVQLIVAVVFSVFAVLILDYSRLGRFMYAAGSNILAARHAGIAIAGAKRVAFVIIGLGAGIVGLITASQMSMSSPYMGDGYTFPAIIAALLGASFLKDGIPNTRGSLIACLLFAVLTVGLIWNDVSLYIKDIFLGALLLFSVGMVYVIKMRQARA